MQRSYTALSLLSARSSCPPHGPSSEPGRHGHRRARRRSSTAPAWAPTTSPSRTATSPSPSPSTRRRRGACPTAASSTAPPTTHGVPGLDRLTLVDFLPNGWAAWPNTYQTVTVPVDTVDKAVVTVARDYEEIELVTTFTVDRAAASSPLETVATNPVASGATYTDIYCGYTFCTNGGYMFGPFADSDSYTVLRPLRQVRARLRQGLRHRPPLPRRRRYDGGTGWKDLYQTSTIAPGEAMTFEAMIQFEDSASISRFVKAVVDERARPVRHRLRRRSRRPRTRSPSRRS